ncbi:WD repeat and coiled-coil-containing protein-like [Candoia aspera]|uniref:WD repeat and coiled-coil-containing protein-like n=1 Tax=Candoia aspera TaxID=51853 RepID=UPI002FD86661
MELGKAKLLRTGLNALYQAIHPIYGIAWTDGKQVALIPLHFHSKEWRFGDSTLIGQFEHVHALYWNACYSADLPALLAVQHKKHVSIWQLIHNVLEKNKLMVFQTCEIAEPFQLLPQGCVWHPKRDILSVFTKRDASILYAVRLDNSKVKADIKSSGIIHCACWTKDGNRLVIAISSALHSYIWDEAQKTLNACTFCPIFDVGGCICAIEATLDFQIAVATELPLDKIHGLNAGITFELPISSEMDFLSTDSSQSTLVLGDEEYSMDLRRKSFDLDKSIAVHSVASSSSGPTDLTNILANHRKLDPSPPIPLSRKVCPSGTGQYSSHLILVTFERKVTTTRKVSIPGILVPDIIAFDLSAQIVAVASNTCNIVLVYSITSSCMPNLQRIQLDQSERSKGLSFLTDKLLLVLVGKQKFTDPVLISSSNSDRYIIRLLMKELVSREDSSSNSGTTQTLSFSSKSSVSLPGKRKHFKNPALGDCIVGQELSGPDNTIIQSPIRRRHMLEVKRPSYEQTSPSNVSIFVEKGALRNSSILETLEAEPINRSVALFGAGTPTRFSNKSTSPKVAQKTLNSPKNSILDNEKITPEISRNVERLYSSFSDLHLRLLELTEFAKNGRRSSLDYPSSQEPPFVHIKYQKCSSNGAIVEETRNVLLCSGKIHLNLVQRLFDLPIVEMKHGPSWIVLIADGEGFIPIDFKAKQEIIIRDGKDNFNAYGSYMFKTNFSS